ncbi:MAG: hypothetical protein KGL39_55805 [Patescibacteria group bacterium]|nr:hypothetical protein [Patescibacteria group bacterium]
MSKTLNKDRQEAVEKLRQWLKPGDTVYTILRSVSRTGMSREISLVISRDNEIQDLDYRVSRALGYSIGNRGGLKIRGCGMDMGFHAVYGLSRVLFPEGFGVTMTKEKYGKQYPRSKAEAEKHYAAGWRSCGRNGDTSGWDNDGGYALNHRWL